MSEPLSHLPHIAAIAELIVPILRKRGIVSAGLLGSLARGEALEKSDIDLLIDYPKGTTLLDAAALELELEGVLGKDVDLVSRKYLHPSIKDRVLGEEVPIL